MNDIKQNHNIVPSGYRILYVLMLLLQSPMSQKEINDKLSKNPSIEQSFTKETLLKIINTLRASGIKIEKQKGLYYISKLPWEFDLDEKYLDILFNLGCFVGALEQRELLKNYNLFLSNLFRYLPDERIRKFQGSFLGAKNKDKYGKYSLLIKKLEQAKKNNCRIKIVFNKESYIFDTYYMEYNSKEVFVTGYNLKDHENKTMNLGEIASIKQLPQKSSGMFFPSNVTFKIKGRLAKSYNLRENEKLIDFDSNTLIISNKGEDKQKLLRRIIKYKNLCEIIAPDSMKEEFKAILRRTLNNYDSSSLNL
ncbi:MAG: WYL domain-containing protein [Candidatus Gastranaerophilales bacterium]|jgi:predicted DNA-binding transcriptional regulator YafY|nr:WYL domain-containing protein [Candidatus Gastranaerophilales bacterium]